MIHEKNAQQEHGAARHPAPKARLYTCQQLFGTDRQIRLLHNGEEYRLSLTKSGKLILTK